MSESMTGNCHAMPPSAHSTVIACTMGDAPNINNSSFFHCQTAQTATDKITCKMLQPVQNNGEMKCV